MRDRKIWIASVAVASIFMVMQIALAQPELGTNKPKPALADPLVSAQPLNAWTGVPLHKLPKRGVVDFEIYRDGRPFPVDPRKPCSVCTLRQNDPACNAKQLRRQNRHARIYGLQGRPYQEREPGSCLCGKKKQQFKRPNINVYWPTMFAGVTEDLFPKKAAINASTHDRFRLVDVYDHLGGFEVSSYERRDNGYCGRERDRYGCLGESRHIQSNVFGVGFREPGQPVDRGIVYPLSQAPSLPNGNATR